MFHWQHKLTFGGQGFSCIIGWKSRSSHNSSKNLFMKGYFGWVPPHNSHIVSLPRAHGNISTLPVAHIILIRSFVFASCLPRRSAFINWPPMDPPTKKRKSVLVGDDGPLDATSGYDADESSAKESGELSILRPQQQRHAVRLMHILQQRHPKKSQPRNSTRPTYSNCSS